MSILERNLLCPSFKQYLLSQVEQKRLLEEMKKNRYPDQLEIQPGIDEIYEHPLWYISGLVPFQCNHCNKVLSSERNLKMHIRRHHTGERPFKCQLCNKAYASYSSLYNHKKIHPVCSLCLKQFEDSSSLKKHLKCYHMEETKYWYECECCDEMFAAPYYLVEHTTIHTGEKPFSCRKCKLRFRTKSIREKHMVQCKINDSKNSKV